MSDEFHAATIDAMEQELETARKAFTNDALAVRGAAGERGASHFNGRSRRVSRAPRRRRPLSCASNPVYHTKCMVSTAFVPSQRARVAVLAAETASEEETKRAKLDLARLLINSPNDAEVREGIEALIGAWQVQRSWLLWDGRRNAEGGADARGRLCLRAVDRAASAGLRGSRGALPAERRKPALG